MMQKVYVEGVANLAQLRAVARGPVVIRLKLNVGALIQLPLPAPQEIPAGNRMRRIQHRHRRGRIGRDRDPLTIQTLIHVALQGGGVAVVFRPVTSEADMPHLPLVEIFSIRVLFRPANKSLAENPVIESLAAICSVAVLPCSLINVSPA